MSSYTHGHAEAVLRSHRWRTAANSAASPDGWFSVLHGEVLIRM